MKKDEAHHQRFGNASLIDLKATSSKSDKLGQVLSEYFDVKSKFQSMNAKELQDNSTAPAITDQDKKDKADAEQAKKARTLLANSTEATELETKTQAIINNIVKPRCAIAEGSFDKSCLGPVAELQFEALAQSANVSAFVVQIDNTKDVDISNRALGRAQDAHSAVITATNDMARKMENCSLKTAEIKRAKKEAGPPVYDPISTITETVYFYITVTGSVTPTWKLVRVTAPIAPTFVSAMRKDTNSLILTMGRPVTGSNGDLVASESMNNQILYSILGQSINVVRP